MLVPHHAQQKVEAENKNGKNKELGGIDGIGTIPQGDEGILQAGQAMCDLPHLASSCAEPGTCP
jgi:hypothetical protein